jgi:hypothetical protein
MGMGFSIKAATLTSLASLAASGAAAAQQPEPPAVTAPAAPPGTGPLQGSLDTPDLGPSCAPPKLFKATIRNVSPGLAAADRAAQPRQLWRLGDKFLRSEESPDPVRGDLPIVIISEPDIWTINRATRQGRHAIDPGPTLNVRAPILPPVPGLPAPMRGLEFGCEPVFVATYAPQQQRNAPLMISYVFRGQPRLVIRYDEYRHGLTERAGMFEPPKNIKITEAGMEPPPTPWGPSRLD